MAIDINVLTSGWTIASVIASFVVAFVALWLGIRSGKQLNEMRRAETARRDIKEIIDWAIEVIDFTAGQTALSSKDTMEVISWHTPFEIVKKTVASEQHVRLNKLSSKAVYIDSLRNRMFPKNTNLRITIHNVRRKIHEHLRLLDLEVKGRVTNTEKASQKHLARLLKAAISLLELTVGIYSDIK